LAVPNIAIPPLPPLGPVPPFAHPNIAIPPFAPFVSEQPLIEIPPCELVGTLVFTLLFLFLFVTFFFASASFASRRGKEISAAKIRIPIIDNAKSFPIGKLFSLLTILFTMT
jgi:hypothetical protein